MPSWSIPPIICGRCRSRWSGLCAALALYGALACGLAAYFWQDGPARLFVFAVMMAAAEWLRGHLFTGFPWNLSAYGWGASLALLQSASLMGAYGLSFLTILLGAVAGGIAVSARWRAPAAMLLLFAVLWGFGVYRLAIHAMRRCAGCAAAAGATRYSAARKNMCAP